MKKMIALVSAIAMVGAVNAADVGLEYVRDVNLGHDGTRLSIGGPLVMGIKPVAGVTVVTGQYNRWSLGTEIPLASVNGVALSGTVAGAYQDTLGGVNGWGAVGGLKVSYPLVKNATVSAGVEHWVGQSRVNNLGGASATVGLNFKF
jgi:hypothetical protein